MPIKPQNAYHKTAGKTTFNLYFDLLNFANDIIPAPFPDFGRKIIQYKKNKVNIFISKIIQPSVENGESRVGRFLIFGIEFFSFMIYNYIIGIRFLKRRLGF